MLSILGALLLSLAHAAPPPDATRLLFVDPQNVGHVMHLYELRNGKIAHLDSQHSTSAQITQAAVFNAGTSPAILGITLNGETLLFRKNSPMIALPFKGNALTEVSDQLALLASSDNELRYIDASGAGRTLAAPFWLDPTVYGTVTHLQLASPNRLVLTTPMFVFEVELAGNGNTLNILKTITLPSSDRALDMLVAGDKVWLRRQAGITFKHYLLLVDLAAGTVKEVPGISSPIDLIAPDPSGSAVLARKGLDFVRIDSTGKETVEAANFFSTGHLAGLGLPVMFAQQYLINAYFPRQPTAPSAPAAAAPVASVPKARRKILDPLEPEDFAALATQEARNNGMKELADEGVEAGFFAEWVNRTTILRYYFKNVPADELKTYGLRFQMDSLKTIPGKETTKVRMFWFLKSLSDGEKQARAAQACADKLGKP